MNDQDGSASSMIALLPMTSDWCCIELPHLTLVYAGEIKDLQESAFNDMCKDACSIAMLARPVTLRVTSREKFGNWSEDPANAVDVFRLQATSELLAMRHQVEGWNKSEFKDFNPHVTIGPPGSVVNPPSYIAFDRIMVAWGRDKDLTFWLKR